MRFDRGMRLFKYFIQIFTNVPRLNRETLSDSNRANEFSPLLPIIEMAFVVIIMYMYMFMFKGDREDIIITQTTTSSKNKHYYCFIMCLIHMNLRYE